MPEQPAPVVTFTPEVHAPDVKVEFTPPEPPPVNVTVQVPEQPTPQVHVQNVITSPKRKVTIERDGQGFVKGGTVEDFVSDGYVKVLESADAAAKEVDNELSTSAAAIATDSASPFPTAPTSPWARPQTPTRPARR